jgi:hypothetical protein
VRRVGRIVTPSAFAVLRVHHELEPARLLDRQLGRLAPLRILSTTRPERAAARSNTPSILAGFRHFIRI